LTVPPSLSGQCEVLTVSLDLPHIPIWWWCLLKNDNNEGVTKSNPTQKCRPAKGTSKGVNIQIIKDTDIKEQPNNKKPKQSTHLFTEDWMTGINSSSIKACTYVSTELMGTTISALKASMVSITVIPAYINTHVCICIYIFIYICTYVHMCFSIYLYIYIYIYIPLQQKNLNYELSGFQLPQGFRPDSYPVDRYHFYHLQ
jgi:hypothetical protein